MPKTSFKSGCKIETGRNSLVKDPPELLALLFGSAAWVIEVVRLCPNSSKRFDLHFDSVWF